ncbi:hypothetical protein [Neobacillus sp. 204]
MFGDSEPSAKGGSYLSLHDVHYQLTGARVKDLDGCGDPFFHCTNWQDS